MKNIKMWLPLLLSFMVLAIALYVVFSDATNGVVQHRDFRVDPQEEVTVLTISDQQGNMVVIEKTGEEQWVLNGAYHANMAAVRDILRTLRRMDVRRPVAVERKNDVIEQLASEGVIVEVFAASHWIRLPGNIRLWPRQKRIKTLFVGENTDDGKATYMQLMNADRPFEIFLPGVTGGIKEVFDPREHLWRDPVVLRLPPGQIKKVQLRCKDNRQESFALIHDLDGGFQIRNHQGETLEEHGIHYERLERYIKAFSQLYYERLIPDSGTNPPEDMYCDDKAFLEIEVVDSEGNKTFMQFFRRYPPQNGTLTSERRDDDPNRFYLRVDQGDYALSQYFVFQPVMRSLSWFLINNDHLMKKTR